jgi:hypothetical protein
MFLFAGVVHKKAAGVMKRGRDAGERHERYALRYYRVWRAYVGSCLDINLIPVELFHEGLYHVQVDRYVVYGRSLRLCGI